MAGEEKQHMIISEEKTVGMIKPYLIDLLDAMELLLF